MGWKLRHQSETHFLNRRIVVDEFGWNFELDQRYVRSLLVAMAMNHCKSMATLGSKGQENNGSTAKLDQKEHTEFRSCAGICQYLTEQRFDIAFSTKEIMREAAGPRDVRIITRSSPTRAWRAREPSDRKISNPRIHHVVQGCVTTFSDMRPFRSSVRHIFQVVGGTS